MTVSSCGWETDKALRSVREFGVVDWLSGISLEMKTRYQRRNGHVGPMQTGLAWRSLKRELADASELKVVTLLGALLRYANTDGDETARLLFRAYVPLSLEHEAFGGYIGFDTLSRLVNRSEGMRRVRRTLSRWCDWIESLEHWKAHLAGRTRRYPRNASDQAVILLWPLAKRYDWTRRDLMTVLCLISRHPATWVCASETELADRIESMGLRICARPCVIQGLPAGSSIALRYSHFWGG